MRLDCRTVREWAARRFERRAISIRETSTYFEKLTALGQRERRERDSERECPPRFLGWRYRISNSRKRPTKAERRAICHPGPTPRSIPLRLRPTRNTSRVSPAAICSLRDFRPTPGPHRPVRSKGVVRRDPPSAKLKTFVWLPTSLGAVFPRKMLEQVESSFSS